MHRISNIKVSNFRSIRFSEFDFTEYTPLVGYNNAGKSNILQALQWVVEYSSLHLDSYKDPSLPVFVEATVSGIDDSVLAGLGETHRKKIEPYVCNGDLCIKRTQLEPGCPKTQIKLEVLSPKEDIGDWVSAPTGIPQALNALFPEVIFVGAMENSAEDVAKNATGTTIGKLMKEIITPIREDYEAQIEAALEPIRIKLSSGGDDKDARLVAVDTEIQTHLQRFFPEVEAKTHIEMPSFDDISKRATLKVFENRYGDDRENDASSMGHGAQRSVQISLINALSSIKRRNVGNPARTVLLLVDEPELYLHPQAIAVARSALKSLSANGYQVAFSTHSGDLVGYDDAANTLIVRRTAEHGTIAASRLANQVKEQIDDAEKQALLLFEFSNSREFLFCDKVLLVEGSTERFVIPHIYEHLFGKTMIEDRIGLIKTEGSGSLPNCKKLLEAMGIQTRCIADLDFLLRNGTVNGLVGVGDARRDELLNLCDALEVAGEIDTADDGWPKKGKGHNAESAFALMASKTEARGPIEDLANDALELGYWIWSRGAIEKHLGLSAKDVNEWKRLVAKLKSNEIADIPDLAAFQSALTF